MTPALAAIGSEPSPAELSAIRAYLETGTVKAAAHKLGLSASTIKFHLANARSRTGAKSTAEAILLLSGHLAT